MRLVIERSAAWAGMAVEPGLDEVIIHDVADEPGALPLLSHVLLEIRKRREGRTLTLAGYTDSGGVREAITRTADSVFGSSSTPGSRGSPAAAFCASQNSGTPARTHASGPRAPSSPPAWATTPTSAPCSTG